jgi:cytochrome P450
MPCADVPSLHFDLSDRSHFREGMPFELFAQIREGAPIWWHPPTEGTRGILETGFYVASHHVDLVAMARDPERFSSRDGVGLRVTDGVPSISSLDPPLHTRWRRLIGRSFTRNKVRRLEDMMEARAERILDDVVGRGECDFVSDVSHLLPLHVIADIVGIPEADRAAVFEDVNRMTRYEDPRAGLPADAFEQAKQSLATYAWHLTRERRAKPRDDIWSELIAAEIELEDGSTTRFDDDELGIWFMTLALAGSETTRNVLAIGLQALVEHPGGRGNPALGIARPVSASHDRSRHGGCREIARGRAARGAALAGGEPRRRRLRGARSLRHRPLTERACGLRRWWAAFLSRCKPRAQGDRGDARRGARSAR